MFVRVTTCGWAGCLFGFVVGCGPCEPGEPPLVPDAEVDGAMVDVASEPDTGWDAMDGGSVDFTIDLPAEDLRIAPGDMVEFAASCNTTSAADSVTHEWEFEGGSPAVSSEQDPGTVTFAALGTYTVRYRCWTDNNATMFAERTIDVVSPRWLPLLADFDTAGTSEVYLSNAALSQPRLHDPTPEPEHPDSFIGEPSLSPDGRYLVYARVDSANTFAVFGIDLEVERPSARVLVSHSAPLSIGPLVWSPHSNKIVYGLSYSTSSSLRGVDISSGLEAPVVLRPTPLDRAGDRVELSYLDWSTTGRYVYFLGQLNDGSTTRGAYVYDTQNRLAGARRLHPDEALGVWAAGPSVAAVILVPAGGSTSRFFAIGAAVSPIVSPTPLAPANIGATDVVSVHSDGAGFAFVGSEGSLRAVFRADFSGGIPTPMSATRQGPWVRHVYDLAWSPAAHDIALLTLPEFDEPPQLSVAFETGEVLNTSPTTSASDAGRLRWSADGRTVAWDVGELGDETSFVASVSGSMLSAQELGSGESARVVQWVGSERIVLQLSSSPLSHVLVEISRPGEVIRLSPLPVGGTLSLIPKFAVAPRGDLAFYRSDWLRGPGELGDVAILSLDRPGDIAVAYPALDPSSPTNVDLFF